MNGYKNKTPIYAVNKRPLQNKGHIQTKSEGLEKIFHGNGDEKKAGVAILISDKIDFQIKAVKRDKEGHYIMIKGSIQEEDITIINIYAPNIGAPQYVRQILTSMKEEINSNTIIVGDFNTPLTTMDRSTKQKINKKRQTLKDTMDQLDLLTSIGCFTLKQSTSTFSQVHMAPSPEYITSLAINLVLVNSKILKSFQSSFLTTGQ